MSNEHLPNPAMKVHYSSKKNDWETPVDLFEKLNKIHNFTLDVCASWANTKCVSYFDKKMNGLNRDWAGNICWMNPPYGKEIGKWVKKAFDETNISHCKVIALLPARTDTKWFHDYIYKKTNVTIEFIKGRLKFVGAKYSAPFPSMIVIFNF